MSPLTQQPSSPIIPLVLALLARHRVRTTRRPLAHGGRPNRAALRLALIRSRREVVPERFLGLVQWCVPRARRAVAVGALDELVEALRCAACAQLRRLCKFAAPALCLGREVRLADL